MAIIPTSSACAWSHNGTTSVPLLTPAPVPASNHSYSFGSDDDGSGEIRTRVVIALTIVRVVLASVGCGANVVAAVVLTNRKLWSPTSMLLLSLVIYDAIYLLLVVPVGVVSISVNVQFSLARWVAGAGEGWGDEWEGRRCTESWSSVLVVAVVVVDGRSSSSNTKSVGDGGVSSSGSGRSGGKKRCLFVVKCCDSNNTTCCRTVSSNSSSSNRRGFGSRETLFLLGR